MFLSLCRSAISASIHIDIVSSKEKETDMEKLTREEIIELVGMIEDCEHHTESEIDELLLKLKNGTVDPYISNYIFYEELTPEEIADKALAYKPIIL